MRGCGARIGTRFVASRESGAHPSYVRLLLDASAEDTCLTEAFSAMWPNAPHRVLQSAIAAAERLTQDRVGEMRVGEAAEIVAELTSGAERLLMQAAG